MNILTVENISKAFSEKILFENVSLGIEDGDKIGLVGVNGTGKSTFLKLISGQLEPDSGRITRGQNIRIQCLSQTLEFDENLTVLEHILHGENPVIKTIGEYESITLQLNEKPDNENLRKKLAEYTLKMDALDGWNLEIQAKSILSKLGILDANKKIKELSGGQRKRIALAQALIQPADLLILDEPTNHIDLETIKWLEEYLKQRKGALLLVTHDRYFLNRIVNRIVEIDKGNLYSYEGNFEYFLEKKTLREEALAAMEEKRGRLYLNELAWIRRGAKARTTKQKARIQRFEEIKKAEIKINNERLEIPVAYTRLGKKVIEINNISKSFDGNVIIKNFSTIINPNDRIGVIGPNGAGKTTLLNLIAGLIKPDSGNIDIGETVKIAYYRQNNEDMDYSIRAIDYIRQTAEYVKTGNGQTLSASQMLEQFLFDDNQRYSFIKNLSGGEKRRLLLAKVLMEKPNVLLLDEPTNDLDIQTLEVLEEYLQNFSGCVLVSSHDRYFLEKTTHKLFALKGDGRIEFYNDLQSYDHSLKANKINKLNFINSSPSFLNSSKSVASAVNKNIKNKISDTSDISNSMAPYDKTSTVSSSNANAKSLKKTKFTYAESREFAQIESIIEELESSLAKITEEMNNNWSDYVKIKELTDKYNTIQAELDRKMQRWVYLNEIAEQIKLKNKINYSSEII
ncbi:MAG: ABC-F family ATP-binding cassette domain-containing protein [Actinobacteria bacterium]|nr:ABC-F family ATP-binding cassette domain-containing protein [Cyanobacteriota bacterium]MCL5771190.1 ABC-F family ATP-binding cassette domain-containing protein [Actinomycetota bacterium]